jgi:DNA-binding CsgD family transcriptional regulator
MLLVERCYEVSILKQTYDCVKQGNGRVSLIGGTIASGKTELLNTVVEHAAESGALVLAAMGSESEQQLPFGLAGQLLRNVALPPDVVASATALLEGAGAAPDASGYPPTRVIQGFCDLLLKLARDRTLVIAVDDVQLADTPSLQALLYLISRLRWAPVLVVLCEGIRRGETYPRFRAELFRQPHCRRIRLGSLSTQGVADLLAEQAGADLVPAFSSISGGNPLLLHALIEDSAPAEGRITGLVAGDAFAQVTLACLRRDPRMLRVVRALAVAGETAGPGLLARLAGLPREVAVEMLDLASQGGLLDAGRFRHVVARTAVLEDLVPQELASLRVKLAGLLHEDGAEGVTIADQLIAAELPGPAWVVPVLCEAGEQVLMDDDVDRAVACFELALLSCTDDTRRAQITAQLARTQWRVNPSAAARHLTPMRDALHEGRLPAQEGAQLVRYLLWHGRVDEAAETLAWLGEPERASDPRLRAELLILQQWLCCTFPALVPDGKGAELSAAAADAAGPLNPRLLAASVLTRTLTRGPSDALVAGAVQVLQSCPLRDATLESITAALWTLVFSDHVDTAAHWCENLIAEATARRARTWQALLTAIRAEIAVRMGDMPAAETHGRAALGLLSPKSWGVAIGSPLASLMIALTTMSRPDEVLEQLKWVVPESMLRTRFGLQYRQARGQFYLLTNRLHAALAEFHTCGELMGRWGLDLPALLPWRTDVAQTQLRLGRREDALAMAREQLARPGMCARTRGNSLRVLAAAQEPKERLAVLRQAVYLLQESGDRLGLALTLAELSTAHHEQGEYGTARMMGRRATQVAKDGAVEELCVRFLPGQSKPAAEDEDVEAEGVDALSDAERRVAALAAVGHTNREIGRKLYITVSTVEQHLTRAYRKLNVRKRNDLPAVLQTYIANSA